MNMGMKSNRKEKVMIKIGQYFALAFLMLSNVPVQAMSLDDEVIQEFETADFSDIEEMHDEYIEEETETSEQIDTDEELLESSEKELEAEVSGTEETVTIEESSEKQSDMKDELPEKSIDSYNFTNSQIINGVRYEWNWDSGTSSLDFNANNGNSQDAIQVIRDNNLLGVQYMVLRNLNEATSSFQILNNLVTLEFYNVTTLATAAFQGLTNLQEVTFNTAINISERAFQECNNLIQVNNSLNMDAIMANAFNGTAIEELEVRVAWATRFASPLSLNGMNSLRKLVNHGGGSSYRNFVGANLPALEVYEGFGYGADMFSPLVEFLNSKAPNLRKIELFSNSSSSSYVFDQLDLRGVPYLEEFIFKHNSSPGNNHSLGMSTFQGLEHLKVVKFDGINEIGIDTFRDTQNLEEVVIKNVTTIGDHAFHNTSSLKSVSADNLITIGHSVFSRSGLEEISFPSLEVTGNYPFERNEYLKKVDLPNLRLGGWALFAYCSSLEEINLPSLERINHSDFSYTTSLETVYLPSATSFNGTTNFSEAGVKNIVLPKMDLTRAPDNIFRGTRVNSLEVAYANDASRLKEIFNISAQIASLRINEQKVFGEDYSDLSESINTLETITLPNTTHIGNAMFRNMTSLKEIEAPKLQEIGEETFRNAGVTSIDFPELETAGSFAFAETNALNYVSLINVSVLGIRAFSGSRVESVQIPKVTKLPSNIFEKCTKLTEVTMPIVESIGADAFLDTKSLKELHIPEVIDLGDRTFFNSGIEYLELPKLTSLGSGVFQGTTNLIYLNVPMIQDILKIDSMFYINGLPYGANISGSIIHGIDTAMINKSGIEVIMTLDENREVIKPLTEDLNDRILAIAIDGREVIEGDTVINLEIGDRVDIPVRSNLIINNSIDDIKADVDHVWLHDGNPMEFGNSLFIEEVMPWHNGSYLRRLVVNHSQTNEEIFSHDSNTVTLNVSYTDELNIEVSAEDSEITIGDSTIITATIENITGYGEVEVSVDLITGLLGGIELVENSISSVLYDKENEMIRDLDETITIPQNGTLEITYEVLGVNNESVENNLQVVLTEVRSGEELHTWAGASRLTVNNGRLRFTSQAPEIIEFEEWDNSNPLKLGAITTQLNSFNLEVEDLRGSNTFAQNEIQGNRSNWRVEVVTDNTFVDETGREIIGLFQLIAQTEDGNWHNAKDGIPLYTHVTNKELPLSSRYHSLDIGNGTQLGVMLNQLTGLIENSEYSVDMTFDLVDAP